MSELSEHVSRLDALRAELEHAADVAREMGEIDLAQRCDAASRQIVPRPFRVVVLGEFKAGKSTLVNALVGRDALPVATRECTAVITRVRRPEPGEREGARLIRSDGTSLDTDLRSLSPFLRVATTQANDEGAVVEEAEVWLPGAGWLPNGVEIVDTPGMNAAGLARERATLGYLPNADAILFVTRADQLLSESEMQFIRDRIASQDLARTFVVVNFMDRIRNPQDRRDMEARLRYQLDQVLGDVPVGRVSAADALEAIEDEDPDSLEKSGLPELQRALEGFLSAERAAMEQERHRRMCGGLKEQVERALRARRDLVAMDKDTRVRRRERLATLARFAEEDGRDLAKRVDVAMAEILDGPLSQVVRTFAERLEGALESGLYPEADQEKGARKLADEVGGAALAQLQEVLRAEAAALQHELSGRLGQMFEQVDLGLGEPNVRMRQPDFDGMIRTYGARDAVAPSAGGVHNAVVYGTIGFLLAGPLGAWVGAGMGLYTGGGPQLSLSGLFRARIDTRTTVESFRKELRTSAEAAVAATKDKMQTDVSSVIRQTIRDLHGKMDQLEGPVQVDPAAVAAIDAALARLA